MFGSLLIIGQQIFMFATLMQVRFTALPGRFASVDVSLGKATKKLPGHRSA
jgi:hypothetical protein